MPNRPQIDASKAIAMAQQGISAPIIAERLGVRTPTVYRAFRKNGFYTKTMKRIECGPESNYPPEGKHKFDRKDEWKNDFDAEEREIAARRILPRDPCFRCGARGDVQCGCSKAPVGWRAG